MASVSGLPCTRTTVMVNILALLRLRVFTRGTDRRRCLDNRDVPGSALPASNAVWHWGFGARVDVPIFDPRAGHRVPPTRPRGHSDPRARIPMAGSWRGTPRPRPGGWRRASRDMLTNLS